MGNTPGKIAGKIEDLDFDELSDDEIAEVDDLVNAIADEDKLTAPLRSKICDMCPDCPDCSLQLGGDADSELPSLILTEFSGMSRCEVAVKLMKMNVYEAVAKANAIPANDDAVPKKEEEEEEAMKVKLKTVEVGPNTSKISTEVVDILFAEEVVAYNGELTFNSDRFDELINCEAVGGGGGSEGYRLKYGAAVDSETKRRRFDVRCDIAIIILLLLILWLVKTRKR